MFNLLTKLFGFHDKDESTSSEESDQSAEKLRSKRAESSAMHDARQARQSSKLGDTAIPITDSRTNMKARSYWNQGLYSRNVQPTPQQHLNMLYAPAVGPIDDSGSESNGRESFGSTKQKALNSYLTKANQEIKSAYGAYEQPVPTESLDQADFAPRELTDTAEITLPRSTQEILREMAQHKDSEVRACIAANELTPAEAMWALSEDESPSVRLKLASNIKCPVALLELLISDSNSLVASRAAITLRKVWKNRDSAA